MASLAFYLTLLLGLQGQTGELGRIVFPTSGPAGAQRHFERGVLLLHGFEYRQARAEFVAAREAAPTFAMAYWGEAMTYNEPIWFAQNRQLARAALQRLSVRPSTAREQAYLAAVETLFGEGSKEHRDFEYAAAMRRLREAYPDDNEAAAFYALALLGTAHGGRDDRTYMRAAAVAEAVLERAPGHPGALHYAIHAYDDPTHAPLGLRAARAYAKVAPASAHAQHMPSHIFVAMGMWDEAALANEGAWQASQHDQAVDAGQYHALWWLQYAYLQQGRFAAARRILTTMEEMAAAQPTPLARFHVVQMRAMYSTETGEADPTRIDTSDLDLPARAAHLFAVGTAALNGGRRQEADDALGALRGLPGSPAAAGSPHSHQHQGHLDAVSIMEKQLAALLLMADGKSGEAIALMTQAVAAEDTMPYEFGPPVPPKPAHELLGDMLLNLGRPDLARVQFELALLRAPKRALSLLGLARASAASGNTPEARRTYDELRRMWHLADPALRTAIEESLGRL